MKIRSEFRKCEWLRREEGSVTLESSLLLPAAILIVVCAALWLTVSAQSGLAYVTAGASADRVAAHWSNSGKHPKSGMYFPAQSDPLYWRWNQDGGSDWLLPIGSFDAEMVSLPSAEYDSSVVRRKLAGAAYDWPAAYRGMSAMSGGGWPRSIVVEAAVPLTLPGGLSLPQLAVGRSAESVTDPAEWIRTIQLIIGYIPRIEAAVGIDHAKQALTPWLDRANPALGKDKSLTFASHLEAERYVRALVKGKKRYFPTSRGDRAVEALDRRNIAHQVYIGPKTTSADVMLQYEKELEILHRNDVSGAVWHFFRRTGESSSGPSPELKRILERHGIVIVIHS